MAGPATDHHEPSPSLPLLVIFNTVDPATHKAPSQTINRPSATRPNGPLLALDQRFNGVNIARGAASRRPTGRPRAPSVLPGGAAELTHCYFPIHEFRASASAPPLQTKSSKRFSNSFSSALLAPS